MANSPPDSQPSENAHTATDDEQAKAPAFMIQPMLLRPQKKYVRARAIIRSASRFLDAVVLLALADVVRLFPRPGSRKAVLVLRLDGFGDFILWLSSGADLVSEFARARGRSILLIKAEWADLAEATELFDEVWPLDSRRFHQDVLYRAKLLLQIRRAGFNTVIQPRAERDFVEDLFVRTTGAAVRIGNCGGSLNIDPHIKRITDQWYTVLVPVPSSDVHEMSRNAAFSRALVDRSPRPISLPLRHTAKPRYGVPNEYFVIVPGGGWKSKRWPIDRYCELAARVRTTFGWQCVVVGGTEDQIDGEEICRTLGEGSLNLTAKPDLLELGAILSGAKLVIGNDTGSCHYSVFVGARTVVVLGGGHYGLFMPYPAGNRAHPITISRHMPCFNCNWRCRFEVAPGAAVPCIDEITVEDVWQGVIRAASGAEIAIQLQHPAPVSEGRS